MKKHNLKLILTIFAAACAALMAPNKVKAQYYSQGQNSQSLVVDKQIRSLNDSHFLDNIAASQKVFINDEVIEFKIIVSNKGTNELTKIKVVDKLPDDLSLIFNPGDYDKNSNSISWTIDKLSAAESKEYLIRAKIVDTDKLGKSPTKKTNQVKGCSEASGCDQDNAYYYVSGRQMPTTGSNDLITETFILMIVASTGLTLRRMARGY